MIRAARVRIIRRGPVSYGKAGINMTKMSRAIYADMFGPDRGRSRSARRHRSHHRGGKGFHHLWRGGEVRRRQGDPRRHGPIASHQQAGRGRYRHHQCVDLGSLGHRERRSRASKTARIHAIGKAGNPDIQPGVTIVIGPGTDVIAGEGKILHRRRLRQPHPFHLPAADRPGADVGVTSLLGGGTGPSHGTFATTCTAGPWHIAR